MIERIYRHVTRCEQSLDQNRPRFGGRKLLCLGPCWYGGMADANGDFKRLSKFKKDPVIENAGYDVTVHTDDNNLPGSRKWARGHLVQFDDARGWGDTTGQDSFFTSNIVKGPEVFRG